jgi:putative tryptophan/tyrosine transport system substrate-binding protein
MTGFVAPKPIQLRLATKFSCLFSRPTMFIFRAIIAGLLSLTGLILPMPASAFDVAILKSNDLTYYNEAVAGATQVLTADATITVYDLRGNVTGGRSIAEKLRAEQPDLVIAVGLKAALAAKLEIFDSPVVVCMVMTPESYGLTASNFYGVLMQAPIVQQLTSLHAVMPQAKRIGLLYDERFTGPIVQEATKEAEKLGLQVVPALIAAPDDLPAALRALTPKIDALWLIQDQTVVSEASVRFILETTLDAKVPVFAFSTTLVQQGALGALVVDGTDTGRQAGYIGKRLLRKEPMKGSRFVRPEKPELALNLNVASYLGLKPPDHLVRAAGKLFSGPGSFAKRDASEALVP